MSGPRVPALRGWTFVLLAAVSVVAFVLLTDQLGLRDRRPSYTAPYTAAELRERPDLAEVLPDHVEATRALLDAVAATASVTWEPADVAVFAHQRDGKNEQVVDGYPALRWDPDHWYTADTTTIDDASIAALAETFREVLEARGFSVATNDRSTFRNPHEIHFVASDEHDSTLQLLDVHGQGRLQVISMTSVHLYRSEACVPDPLACRPSVADPLAGS